MKFAIEHTFTGIDLGAYEELYFDEAFNEAMCKKVRLARKVLKREVSNGMVVRDLEVGPDRQLPGPAAKVLGTDRIVYTEKLRYRLGSNEGTWETISAVLSDKIISKGTFGFASARNGVTRWVKGEVAVKIFGVGGMIEKLVVGEVEKSYADAAAFTQAWINEKLA